MDSMSKILTAVIIAGVASMIIPALASGFLTNLNTTYPVGSDGRWVYTVANLAPMVAIGGLWVGVIIYAVKTFGK